MKLSGNQPRPDRVHRNVDDKKRGWDRREKIAGVLRLYVDRLGLTQADLSQLLNIDKSTVSKNLNGETEPKSKDQIKRWMDVLHIRGGQRRLLLAMYGDDDEDLATRYDVATAAQETTDSLTTVVTEQFSEFSGTLVEVLSPLVEKARHDGKKTLQSAGSEIISVPSLGVPDSDPDAEGSAARRRFQAALGRVADLYRAERYIEAAALARQSFDIVPEFNSVLACFEACSLNEIDDAVGARRNALFILNDHNSDAHSINLAARILVSVGDEHEVRELVSRLRASGQLDDDIAFDYAYRLVQDHLESQADAYIEQAIKSTTLRIRAGGLYLRAITLFRRGEFNQAAQSFGVVGELMPEMWRMWHLKSAAEYEAGRYLEAANTLLDLANLQPTRAIEGESIRFWVAGCYECAGDERAAIKELRLACADRPSRRSFERSALLLRRGTHYEEAIKVGEEARRRDMATGSTLSELGFSYFLVGNHCLAADRLAESLQHEDELAEHVSAEIRRFLLPRARKKCNDRRRRTK